MEEQNGTEQMLQTFIADLVKEAGVEGLDLDELTLDLTAQLDAVMIAALPDDSLQELEGLYNNPDSQGSFSDIIDRAHLDRDAITQEVLAQYRTKFLEEHTHAN